MKQRAQALLLACFVTLVASGCRLPVVQSWAYPHDVTVSLQDGIPCFSIEDDETVLRKDVHIIGIDVGRKPDDGKPGRVWRFDWGKAFILPSGECLSYGKDAGRERRMIVAADCVYYKNNPPERPFTMLPSGECFFDVQAGELEEGEVYNVELDAIVGEKKEHYFSAYFCLTRGENGEKVVRKLKPDPATQKVEFCR
jgi:hypothetical protein